MSSTWQRSHGFATGSSAGGLNGTKRGHELHWATTSGGNHLASRRFGGTVQEGRPPRQVLELFMTRWTNMAPHAPQVRLGSTAEPACRSGVCRNLPDDADAKWPANSLRGGGRRVLTWHVQGGVPPVVGSLTDGAQATVYEAGWLLRT